jgi:hypothetical protein
MATPRHRTIKEELRELGSKYPELRDPDAKVTKTAKAVYDAYVKLGRPPGLYTQWKAVSRLIEVKPSLVGGQKKPAPQASVPADVEALAKRMGVKDPVGAMQRFEQRTAATKDAAPSLVDILRRSPSSHA